MKHFIPSIIVVFTISSFQLNAQIDSDYALSEEGLTRSEMISQIPPLEMIKFSKTLPPNTQAQLWQTKFNDTIKNGGLSKEEIRVIKRVLLPAVKPKSFSNNNSLLARRAKRVERILREQYHWDDEKVFILLSNLYTLDEFKEYWK